MSRYMAETKPTKQLKHIGQERPNFNPISMFSYVIKSSVHSRCEMSQAIIVPQQPLFQLFSTSGPDKKARQEKAQLAKRTCQQSFYTCPEEAQCPACRRMRKSSGQFVFYTKNVI